MTIRIATPADASNILEIYAPIIEQTAISFEVELPTLEQFQQRMTTVLQQYPWLVWEKAGQILGYAYAGAHHVRAAYQWSVDTSIYIHADARRQGIGRSLYKCLFQLLRQQGFYNAYAGITLPNPSSIGLHESLGFQPIGVHHHVGYKLGKWLDVGWWQLQLQGWPDCPKPPVAFHQYQQHLDINLLSI